LPLSRALEHTIQIHTTTTHTPTNCHWRGSISVSLVNSFTLPGDDWERGEAERKWKWALIGKVSFSTSYSGGSVGGSSDDVCENIKQDQILLPAAVAAVAVVVLFCLSRILSAHFHEWIACSVPEHLASLFRVLSWMLSLKISLFTKRNNFLWPLWC